MRLFVLEMEKECLDVFPEILRSSPVLVWMNGRHHENERCQICLLLEDCRILVCQIDNCRGNSNLQFPFLFRIAEKAILYRYNVLNAFLTPNSFALSLSRVSALGEKSNACSRIEGNADCKGNSMFPTPQPASRNTMFSCKFATCLISNNYTSLEFVARYKGRGKSGGR